MLIRLHLHSGSLPSVFGFCFAVFRYFMIMIMGIRYTTIRLMIGMSRQRWMESYGLHIAVRRHCSFLR